MSTAVVWDTACRCLVTVGSAGVTPPPLALQWQGMWDSAITYRPGDMVEYSGVTYVSYRDNLNVQPGTNAAVWDDLPGGTGSASTVDGGTP